MQSNDNIAALKDFCEVARQYKCNEIDENAFEKKLRAFYASHDIE